MTDKDKFLIKRPCPICGESRYRNIYKAAADPFFSIRFKLTNATIVQCSSCRTRYTNPILKPEIDALQYLEGEGYNRSTEKSPQFLVWEDQIICVKEILTHGPMMNNRLLDVGCGEGGLVYLCQKKNFDAHGIELNKNAVLRAASLGIPNITNDRLDAFENSSFNIITAIHVLEHLHDCRSFAFEAARILKTKGIVIIAVPNYFAFQSRFKQMRYWNFPFQHMNGLTSWSLDYLFEGFGFHRVPMQASFCKQVEGLSLKSRINMIITKLLGNTLNLFPSKLVCVYKKIRAGNKVSTSID